MVPQAVIGRTLPGRYPRWGYLDRLDVNEYMPRACALTLTLFVLAAMVVLVLQHMVPTSPLRVGPLPPPALAEVHLQPTLILPPPLRPAASRTTVPVVMRASGVPQPMDDALVPEETPIRAPGGAVGGREEGVDGEGWDGSDPEAGYSFDPASPQPGADAFVAVEHEPQLVWMREPTYPELARDAGIEGRVLARVLVGPDGAVQRVVLLQGVLGLDEAALEAAATAVFRPALQQGQLSVWVVIPIEFNLHR